MERYARQCDITGKGMNEGWCWGDGIFYSATEKDTIAELRKDYPQHKDLSDDELMLWAYDEEILYWTDWFDEEYEPGDIYYDADGNEYEVKEDKKEDKMDIIHYTVDLQHLFDVQDQQLTANKTAQEKKAEEFKQNKKELLKYVLPLMHGIYALHNRKCNKTNMTSTGEKGLLGNSKVNIEKKLKFIIESDYHFKDNGSLFECSLNLPLNNNIQVCLNKENKLKATTGLGYSMTSLIKNDPNVYGKSIEDELLKVAKVCAIYTEEWK